MNSRTWSRASALSLVFGLLIVAMAEAQPGRGPGGFRGGLDGGMFGLLRLDEVQQEIGVVENQRQQLADLETELRDQVQTEMRDMFEGMRDLSDEERQERFGKIRARFQSIQQDAEKRIGNILMPHQLERLKQIEIQSRIQRQGAAALTSDELAKQLGLTAEQQEDLEARAEEIQKEVDQKVAQIRLEARQKLLEVLTAEQRQKLEALMGATIELPQDQGFGRGGLGRWGDRDGRRNQADRPAEEAN